MEIFNATNLVYILGGFIKTIEISVLSIICSVVVGTVLALVKSYGPRPFRWLVSAYIELFRCTPNLLWILFIYFTVQGVDIFISTLAFTLFTSAVMAEIVREMQHAREAFYKRYSAGKWKMTDGKDIVVNRAKLGRQGCVVVIAAAYRFKLAEVGQDPVSVVAGELETGDLG